MKKVNIFTHLRAFRAGAVLLILCLIFTGCGTDGGTDQTAPESASASDTNSDQTNSGNNNTTQDGKAEPGTLTASNTAAGNKLYLKERTSAQFNEPEQGYETVSRFFDVWDGKIYLFRVEYSAEAERQRVCAQTFDSKTQAIEQYILMPEIPGLENYTFYSVGLTSDGDVSMKLFDLYGEGTRYYLAKTDLQGNVLETADSFPEEAEYPWNIDVYSGQRVFHLTDGRTILSKADRDTFVTNLTWFEGNSGQILAQIENGTPEAICCDEDGTLYCLAGDTLLHLDTEKNIQDELFFLRENGITHGEDFALFTTDEGIQLCRMDNEEILIYILTDQKVVNDEEILLACPGGTVGMGYIQRKASTFPYDTGGLPINMETAESEAYQEDYRNRILAELTAGKGPDMLLLSRNDLALLAEKGYLCDLSEMISEDVKAQLIPSVLELGTVDGKLMAITPQVEFSTMITGNKTWEKAGWNITEFKELAESRNDWEILVSYLNSNVSFYTLYYFMFGDGIMNSPLLDLEQGVSHLDSEEFVEILELCKKYSANNITLDGSEIDAFLKEGKIAAKRVSIYDLTDFSNMMSRYSKDCHLVGAPSESGSGSYVEAYSFQYLVVNEKSAHKEEIQKFIAYLLNYDNQYTVDGCSVRMDVIRDSVFKDPDLGYVIRHSVDPGDPMVTLLEAVKPDGTPWLEEFLDFVKNSEPAPDMPDEITSIIGSELYSYYEEGRSARETADNIHNRVQLYLDERK